MFIVGERTYGFLAKVIHLGMWLWQIAHFKLPKKYPNHFLIELEGNTIEAIWPEVVKVPLRKRAEESWVWKVPDSLYPTTMVGHHYEATNFYWHAVRIISMWFHLWLGEGEEPDWDGDETEREFSCVELTARTMRDLGHSDLNPFVNPVEFTDYMNKHYKLKKY
jgi:hypothetical protein